MRFPRLTFPLTVDFGSSGYWIGDVGPFHYGAAVTAFFCGDDLTDNVGDGLLLMRRLEDILQTFGRHLQPYVVEQPVPAETVLHLEKSLTDCSMCFAFAAEPAQKCHNLHVAMICGLLQLLKTICIIDIKRTII